jgi:hypothetical protein
MLCSVSVNFNFYLSIKDVYLNVIALHVSVILAIIRWFINYKMGPSALLNCTAQCIRCYWSYRVKHGQCI